MEELIDRINQVAVPRNNPKTVEQLRSILPACGDGAKKTLASLPRGQQRRLVKKPPLPLNSMKLNSILGAFAAAFVSIGLSGCASSLTSASTPGATHPFG